MSDHIDELLDEWFERSFRRLRIGRKIQCTITRTKVVRAKNVSAPRKSMQGGRKKLVNLLHKAPEVMVKISGGGKGMPQIKAHFDYISRNGQVELENENGESLQGRGDLRDLGDEWQFGQYGIPEAGHCKQAFNIILSMPPGVSRQAVKDAARDFAARQFGSNHPYVFAEHDDEAHPHVHLCVKALGNDGTRLNPRKEDLQRWREEFAQSLREQGVAANATRRVARGVIRKSIRQQVLQIERRGQTTAEVDGQRRADADDLKGEPMRPNGPWHAMDETRKQVITVYREAARLLVSSPQIDDRRLALEIVEFVRTMPSLGFAREVAASTERGERIRQERRSPQGQGSKYPKSGGKPDERER